MKETGAAIAWAAVVIAGMYFATILVQDNHPWFGLFVLLVVANAQIKVK